MTQTLSLFDHVLAKLRAAETPPKGLALDELIHWFKQKFTQDINRSLVSEPMTIRCNYFEAVMNKNE